MTIYEKLSLLLDELVTEGDLPWNEKVELVREEVDPIVLQEFISWLEED